MRRKPWRPPDQGKLHCTKGGSTKEKGFKKGNNLGRKVWSEAGSAAKRKVIVGGVSCSCFCVRFRTCDCRLFGVFCTLETSEARQITSWGSRRILEAHKTDSIDRDRPTGARRCKSYVCIHILLMLCDKPRGRRAKGLIWPSVQV